MAENPLQTPDGRYIVVRGRLWRASDPRLSDKDRERLVKNLMDARREVGKARREGDDPGEKAARAKVHAAKVALGERGPVWWEDDAPDQTRTLARNSTYADWWEALAAE